jgi:hypothetical protein
MLSSGLDYANVDADGSGLINSTDVDIVTAFYGQFTDGAFVPAPDISSLIPEAPALSIEGGPLNAGEASTLTVVLGPATTPSAVGYGLALNITYDPQLIDEGSITVDFSNSFLGSDLLTINSISNGPGRLELALSRKDQTNTANTSGEVCRINFTPVENNAGEDYTMNLGIIPNAYLSSDETNMPIRGGSANIEVRGVTAVREPNWASGLNIYPNPYTSGQVYLRGDLPTLDQVILMDANGRKIKTYQGDIRQINLESLPGGSYFIQLQSAGEQVTRKLMKL